MNEFITCLKNYASFQGRARRRELWMFFLFVFLLRIGAIFLDIAVFDEPSLFYGLSLLGFILPEWAVWVRRMHDVNKSGWFFLIPIYNLILACTPGTSGQNRFGDDPKSSTIPA